MAQAIKKSGELQQAAPSGVSKNAHEIFQQLSLFPELNPNPIIEINRQGVVIYANPSAWKVLESVGGNTTDIAQFIPEDLHNNLSEWSGQEERLDVQEVAVAGKVFAEVVHFMPAINVVRIYAIDITRQKQIGRQLRDSEEHYRQFTNLTSDFVHICSRIGDEPFRMQWTGGAINSISGYSAEEIFQLGCFIPLVHPDDRERVASELIRIVPGEVKIIEYRIIAKNGAVCWIAEKCRCEKGDEEGELLLYSSIRDITDRKQMEDSLQRTFADLQRHDRRMVLLHEMNDQLLSVESREELCAVIINSAEKLFAPNSGLLAIYAESSRDYKIVASWGAEYDMNLSFPSSDCWALEEKMPHKVYSPEQSLECRLFQGMQQEPHFCLPLIARGETIGLLQIISSDGETSSRFDEMYNFAMTMSETITLALSNLLLREALREETIRDPLTGLFNRRYLEETLAISLSNHQRSNEPLTVAMLDLDHFKSFNDKYGHEAGDIVLQEIGALLHNSLRGGDIACRYGGEELTIILSGATLAHAVPRLDSVRQMIMDLCLQCGGQELKQITVSIGVAEAEPDEKDSAALLKRADIALYQAKQQGRNRIITA